MSDTTFGLLPYLVGCAMVMSLPIGIARILVGVEVFLRLARIHLASDVDSAIRALVGGRINNVRAVGEENTLAFDGNIFRHAERDLEALGRADHRVSDAGVATG